MKRYSWPENHWHWPVPLTHKHGVRAGGLIFTGGQADLNRQGEVVSPNDLERQCTSVMRFVADILSDLDASLHDVVRWVIYFVGNEKDERYILSRIAEQLPDEIRPVVSTICLPSLCYPGMRIELEAVAWCPPAGAKSAEFFRDAALPSLPEHFSHVVRCDQWVFTSDLSAIDNAGEVQHPDALLAQTEIMMDALSRALKLASASMDDVLKLNVFYQGDGTAENWSEPARIRALCFPDPGPAATGITVDSFATPGLMTKIAVTAGISPDGAVDRQFSWPENHWDWTESLPYKHGNRMENLIHLGGQVALNKNAQVLHPGDMVAQTRIAMRNIEIVLEDLGATLDDVVKVTTFYQGNASAEALHENLLIRSASYQSPGPATSGIPVPHLVYENMVIEIEVIAILDAIQP